ncbi:sugar transferase [Enteractinococcus coprophilus]|uniref:Lipopolysaccharide/colanic/teichoic acid biosynthesis glycosyltransferase n=1 Tax=Enteractinococcus coprophilus TaxID=1027633 RepID=A0A543AMN8_9MICC|nr:sugar transferase [Enteractinococcus coprophilus]TQL73850.1 lipopolysaccharide/colanic/teichoic acid biosynthesis glycosyltransferase [Enteractinococcus coprophilus]
MGTSKKKYDYLKRAIDIVGSGVALVALSPIIGAVGLAVRSKLGSPIIFQQERPGKDGKIFTIYKFRSMLDVDEAKGLVSNEDRITSFGQKLRSTSLDELPSLWNVLRGDMSLVGPRPLHVRYLPRYNAHQRRRHEVRPGITGLAQVSGRNLLNWSDRLDMDVEYVEQRSLSLDCQIVWKTVAAVLDRSGISAEGHVASSEFTGAATANQQAADAA